MERTCDMAKGDGAPTSGCRGVTLLELLVVVVVMAVMISILLPALRGSRAASENMRRLNTTRNLVVATFAYTNDYDLQFPYFGQAGDPMARVSYEGWRFRANTSYFGRHWQYWASLLVPTYYSNERDELLNLRLNNLGGAEEDQPEGLFRTLFALSHTTSAAPAYWRNDDPPADLALLRNTRRSEMTFPSSKGLIADLAFDVEDESTDHGTIHARIGMGDGSASRRPWGVEDHAGAVMRPFGAIPWEVMSTRDGLRGRDH